MKMLELPASARETARRVS